MRYFLIDYDIHAIRTKFAWVHVMVAVCGCWCILAALAVIEFVMNVTVFQVSISEDLNGNPAISGCIETKEILHFEPHSRFCSAFAMCHHSCFTN